MTREELWLAAIAGLDGVNPPDYPAWHYEEMLAAIYDVVTGAATPRAFPARSWKLDEFLYAVYCVAAGIADPGCPEPTDRIELFWKGIYDGVKGEAGAFVPTPVWRIEEFLKACFDASSDWGGTLVSGNAPLTLSNAFAKPIKSLTQTGLCTQASTPTPSAPVPIKCNNGALTIVDDELPSAYKRVIGFACNNNAVWQITDFKLRGSDTLRFSVSITNGCNIIGVYTGSASGDNYSVYCQPNSGNFLRYKDGAYPSYLDTNKRYDIVITPTGTSGMKVDSTWTEEEFTTPTDMLIGTISMSSTSAKLKGNLYGDIIVDGRLHLVPCERVADNVLGYFDLVGRTFYEPYTGYDGATSLGYDGSHYVLQTVGTPEVLTVTDADSNTQTASVHNLFSVDTHADTQELVSGLVTRNVGVKALDGTEEWKKTSGVFYAYVADMLRPSSAKTLLSSHYNGSTASNANMPDNSIKLSFTSTYPDNGIVVIKDTAYSTKDEFSAYLAAQYAAGTPVIIVYPLATPTTEQVAAQPLTTAAGTNTVSVTAEVSPIALSCKYYGSGS